MSHLEKHATTRNRTHTKPSDSESPTHPEQGRESLLWASLTLDSVALDAVELLTLLASVFPMLGLQKYQMPDPALGGASLSTKLAAGAFLIRELLPSAGRDRGNSSVPP